ncbi:MFS transporter [Pseudonocardia sp. KRD-184]|uniref:MFS transporter n=1 Tax=Pseudonocardia oceani TaxID=2792013 RepID=A0ABS6U7J3_9PSEU|nr:MFS transporter [Pseudonocardia oceani]MBW0088316.1 MFS transporter [Pseudonocardia oceani]MBW0094525.1 MFS transporter [Pseudonocardia oceani]MBW0107414.1 MFS transporter [Pseudonocardia oceani]MBW0120486.1 MFS transporter [Pseudonocardia oceani]MBW0127963.1 MFS transporter [Pseudonocardia oceani]
MTTLPRPLRPFRHRDYRLLVASMASSLFATGVWLLAVVYQVIALGGGPTELSLVVAAGSVGLLASVLVGGIAADRLPRRALLIGVESVRVVAAGAAAALSLTGSLQLWHLAIASLLLGSAEGFYFPAYSALLPTLLPADELLAANGVEGTLRPVVMQALGPALAGVLVSAFLPGAAIVAAAVANLAALLPLLVMRVAPVAERADGPVSVLADLREGFGYFLRTGWLFATLAFASVLVLLIIGPIEVLVPFAVRDQTGSGPGGYAFVLASYGVGGVVGSVAASAGRLPRRYLTWMILLWGAGCLPLVVMGVTDLLWVMGAAAFVVGVTGAAATVIWGTLLQRRVPPHLLGRVSSLDFFVSLALMPISMALAGPVGDALGLPLTFLLAGAIPVFLSIAAILGWRLYRDEIAHPLDVPAEEVSAAPAS